ncbi:pickpocket protein 19-like [Cochliomyia hominivorax]
MLIHQDYRHFKVNSSSKLQYFSSIPPKTVKSMKAWERESAKKYEQGYFNYFTDIVQEFVGTFTMHGVDRIFQRKLNKYKKITWIIGFSICFIILIFVSAQVAISYNTKPLITVVSKTHLPVFRIPFPEVTICNKNRFNWHRIEQAQEMFLKPEHKNSEYQDIFNQIINAYDTIMFGKFYKFENLTKMPLQKLQELNYVNFTMVSEFMAWKCHEIFSICLWIMKYYDCCEIFFQRNSQMGTCLAFNSIEQPEGKRKQATDFYWPWRTKGQGEDHGMEIRVHLREHKHSPMSENKKGILVMLAEPNVWYSTPVEVNTHTDTSISITAVLQTFDNYTRIFSPKIRECVFEDEKNSIYYKSLPTHPYMFENCQAQCQQEYLVKYCNCTFELFFPPGPYRPCQVSDYPCLYRNNRKFNKLLI